MFDYSKVHEIDLEIVKQISLICEKHDITYYLGAGSLLGAVRHKGFIPWDDDIDLLMPYEDYLRFLRVALDEIGDEYFIQTVESDPYWFRAYATVQKRGTAAIGNWKYLAQQRVWVDIFPLAGMNSMPELKIKRLALIICHYVLMDHYMKINKDEFLRKLTPVGYYLCRAFYQIPYKIRLKLHKFIVHWICSGKGKKYMTEV